MADPPRYPDTSDDTGSRSGHGSATSTPRWVKVVGIIVFVLFVVLLLVQHLAGGGMAGLHQ